MVRVHVPRSLEVAIASTVAALYAVLVALLPFLSFYALQFRVADALLTLPMLLGRPAAVGLALGCLIANYLSSPWSGALRIVDSTMGALANLVAGELAYRWGRGAGLGRRAVVTVAEAAVVAVVVGSYLSLFGEGLPYVVIPLLFASSVGTITVLGLALLAILERTPLVRWVVR